MKNVLLIAILLTSKTGFAQNRNNAYTDSIKAFQKNYVDSHEAVKGKDRNYLQFFAVDSTYKVFAHFEKLKAVQAFSMPTSTTAVQQFYRYGKISFTIKDSSCQLFVYQSKSLMLTPEYSNYLFIPFTDATNGAETYEGGKYLDITMQDIRNNTIVLDFNKAYNPYCAYGVAYSCPVPPKENALAVAIRAGEKKYEKTAH